jgi:hypothetical protein
MSTIGIVLIVTVLSCIATNASSRDLRLCFSTISPISCMEHGFSRHAVQFCEGYAAFVAPTGRKLFDMNKLMGCLTVQELKNLD